MNETQSVKPMNSVYTMPDYKRPVYVTPERFENGGLFTLKTHEMFFVQTARTRKKFEKEQQSLQVTKISASGNLGE